MPRQIARAAYAHMYRPTVGDRVRLADTELFIEVEADRTICGGEVKSGGEKVTRDRAGQSHRTRAQGAVDRVIANPLVLDHREGDIGIRDGRVAGIGKAGNRDTRPGVDPATYAVRADGALLTCEPASVPPLAQRYFLY